MERTGWEVFAWVLMSNHYHLIFKTPQPNLVEGMRWFQNTWTKRMNARHGLWGHLFGGRYKSVLVESDTHLSVLIDYVHLNPFRAGLANLRKGLECYPWSSLGDYLLPPRKRSGWVRADLGFAQRGYAGERVAERRRYLAHLEEIARQEKGIPSAPGEGERTLQSSLRRGWYFGGESFRESMLDRLAAGQKREGGKGKEEVSTRVRLCG
ncbi:transposase [Haloferula sp.]|uniref:transposase n=1 Tax=Haloferula sp. TaxID=2497595 RepID=UPI003C75C51B